MSTSNTSFEHVLHNLHERDRIIDESKEVLDKVLQYIGTHCHHSSYIYSIQSIRSKLCFLYDEYKATMSRFNVGIVSFISDYYSVIDKHADQFNSRYLHIYSDHKTHYNPIMTSTAKSATFDIEELINIFKEHCYDFKYFRFHSNASHVRRSRERTWAIYLKLSNYIASENIYDTSDLLMHEYDTCFNAISKIVIVQDEKATHKKSKSQKIVISQECSDMLNRLRYLVQQFNNIKLDFKLIEEVFDYCECGNVMQVLVGSSEIVCNNCGYIYELKGTVFDDNQFYSQDSTRYKHAGYEPSKHCKSWLERIQARETNTISDKHLEKIEMCIKRDGITNKKRLTIEQLRRYLKDTGLTELNEHVALIKRLITGTIPPQLTYAETQDITNSFSKAVKAYNIIRPSNKSNMVFYPFVIWKLIEMHVSDFNKRKNLLSFIHLQGTQTLVQNDQIWLQICNVTSGFKYVPTDRYKYSD